MAIVIKISLKDDIRRISFEKTPSFQELAEKIYQIYRIQTFKLQYVDEEGDLITIGTDFELSEAVTFAKDSNSRVLKMVITSNEEPNLMASFLGPIESSIPNLVNVISKPIIDMLTQSIQSMSVAGLPNFNAEKKAFDETESNRKLEEALRALLNEEEEQNKKEQAEKQRLVEEDRERLRQQKFAEEQILAESKKLALEMERKKIEAELQRERLLLEEERRKMEDERKRKEQEEEERKMERERKRLEQKLRLERERLEEEERKRQQEEEDRRRFEEEKRRVEEEELKKLNEEKQLLEQLKRIEEEKRLEEERMVKAQQELELKKAEERRVQEERQRQKLELFQKLEEERLQQEAEKLKQEKIRQEAEKLKQMEQEVLRKLEEERLRAQQPIPIHNPVRGGLNYSSYFQSKLMAQFCGTPNPLVNVPFLVVWTVKNSGEVPWGAGVTLREFHNNPNIKTINFNWNVKALSVGESYDLPVNLSISKAGEYLIQFSLVDASGRKFGDPLEQHVFVSAPPPSVAIPNAYRQTIDILHRMGFNDDDLNLSILDNVNGDLNQAIPALLDLTKSR